MHQAVCAITNPAKIQTILQTSHEIFGGESCHIAFAVIESGVPEQPFGGEETCAGARNRVANAHRLLPRADFWVAIEAGTDGDSTFSWVVVENTSQRGEVRSTTLPLPVMILEKVREDEAPDPVMLRYTGVDGTGRKEGTIGVFTVRKLTHTGIYYRVAVLALSPFHNAVHQALQDGQGVHAASSIQCAMLDATLPHLIGPTESVTFQQHFFQPPAQLNGRGFQAIRSTYSRRDARAEFIF